MSRFESWENEVDVRNKIKRVGFPAIYKECSQLRRSLLESMGSDPNNPSRWHIINTWKKLPWQCIVSNESKEFYQWKKEAEYPRSWSFFSMSQLNRADENLDNSKYVRCDKIRQSLIDKYHQVSGEFSKKQRKIFVRNNLPKECKEDDNSLIGDYWLKMIGVRRVDTRSKYD